MIQIKEPNGEFIKRPQIKGWQKTPVRRSPLQKAQRIKEQEISGCCDVHSTNTESPISKRGWYNWKNSRERGKGRWARAASTQGGQEQSTRQHTYNVVTWGPAARTGSQEAKPLRAGDHRESQSQGGTGDWQRWQQHHPVHTLPWLQRATQGAATVPPPSHLLGHK